MPDSQHFHEDPQVHAIAQGFQQQYEVSDEVYSYIVYGAEVPVTGDGGVAEDRDDAVAVMAVMPPMMPGGLPIPVVVPLLDPDPAYTIDRDAEHLEPMDVVAFYDGEYEETRIGLVTEIDADESMVSLATGTGDNTEIVSVYTGGDTVEVTINGESLGGDAQTADHADAHEQDWWRIDEVEDQIDDEVEDH